MATGKKDMKKEGTVKGYVKNNSGSIYGIELADGTQFFLSRSSKIDLAKFPVGSYADITYGMFNNRNYINAIVPAQSPQEELAGEPLEDDFVPERQEEPEYAPGPAAPSPATSAPAPATPPPAQQPATPAPTVPAARVPIKDLSMDDRRALLAAMEWGDKKALVDFEKQAQADYWAGKTVFDRDVFNLNTEKFDFEKRRAVEIADQVRMKVRAEMIPIAAEIFARSRDMNNDPPVPAPEQLEQIFKIAHYLSLGAENGFPQALEEVRKRIQAQNSARAGQQTQRNQGGYQGRAPSPGA